MWIFIFQMEIRLLEHLLNTSTTLPLKIANQGGPPAIPLLAVLCLPFGACLASSNPSQLPAPGLTHGNASLWRTFSQPELYALQLGSFLEMVNLYCTGQREKVMSCCAENPISVLPKWLQENASQIHFPLHCQAINL